MTRAHSSKKKVFLGIGLGVVILGALAYGLTRRSGEKRRIQGEMELGEKSLAKILVDFARGQVRAKFAAERVLRWDCEVQGSASDPENPFPFKGEARLNLVDFDGVNCDVTIPADRATAIHGNEGQIDVLEPKAPLDVELGNGSIQFTPAGFAEYRFENRLKNGQTDDFPSSEADDAVEVRLSVENGQLRYSAAKP